jgi:hypothetical protein
MRRRRDWWLIYKKRKEALGGDSQSELAGLEKMQSWQGPLPAAASASGVKKRRQGRRRLRRRRKQQSWRRRSRRRQRCVGHHGERPAPPATKTRGGWSVSLPPQPDGSWAVFWGLTGPKPVYRTAHKCLDVSQSGSKNTPRNRPKPQIKHSHRTRPEQ